MNSKNESREQTTVSDGKKSELTGILEDAGSLESKGVTPGKGKQEIQTQRNVSWSAVRKQDKGPYRANGSTLKPYEETPEPESTISSSETPSWGVYARIKFRQEQSVPKKIKAKAPKPGNKNPLNPVDNSQNGETNPSARQPERQDSSYDRVADAEAKSGAFNPLAKHQKNDTRDRSETIEDSQNESQRTMQKAFQRVTSRASASYSSPISTSSITDIEQDTQQREQTKKSDNESSNEQNPKQDQSRKKVENENAQRQKKNVNSFLANSNKKQKENKRKGKILNYIRENPSIVPIAIALCFFTLLFILIMAFVLGSGGSVESSNSDSSNLDSRYDFTQTTVTLTNSYTDPQDRVQLQQLMFEDLIKGAAYAELYDSLENSNLTKDQMVELIASNMVVFRALALHAGKYDSNTKEMEIQSGYTGIPYCDIRNGCDVVSYKGATTYLISTFGTYDGSLIKSIPAAKGDVLTAINEAYEKTKEKILVPSSFNEILTNYNFDNPPYTQAIKQNMITKAADGKKYDTIIKEIGEYKNYQIYDLEEHVMSYTYSSSTTYWWPIGGSQDSSGLYSGTTSWTRISSPYGSRIHPITGKQSFHTGIDIPATGGTPIIATRSGTVTIATYNSSYGNYVEINHGDGTASRYAHMMNGGILVKVGEKVTQGQIIGKVGTTGSSTGNHLHFEIRIDGQTTDPTKYVSASNQRPKEVNKVVGVKGSSDAQSVCLTLKNSGFSDNAVAALMSNIHRESNFKVTALGDHGTSYGLCQWHLGRYDNLKNYCGSRLNTVECQIDYLIYELKNSNRGVYNNLISNESASSMSAYFCINFERPANRYVTCPQRYNAGYLTYASNGCK